MRGAPGAVREAAERAAGLLDRHYRWLLPVALIAMASFAWTRRFVLDDAFISFRYALNLVEGHGLVWNLGERVEGYSNFLWTLLMSVPFLLGIDPVAFCFRLGPLLAITTLYFCSRIAFLLVGSRSAALISVILVGSNPSFAAFATSGLETPLVTCLETLMLWLLLERAPSTRLDSARRIGMSLVAAAALLTRLDAALVVGALLVIEALDSWRRIPSRAEASRALALLCVPVLLLVGGWFGWKYVYYGSLLPNTFYAKTGAGLAWLRGTQYFRAFVSSYLFFPLLLVLPLSSLRLWTESWRALAALTWMSLIPPVYVAAIGGDFMEFRMLVPVLPPLILLIVWGVVVLLRQPLLQAACILLVLVGAVHHARTFRYTAGVESIAGLASHLHHPAADWVGIGKTLGQTFHDSPDVTVAVTAAGAIPFYSRLPALDMLGLNDAWIARHGVAIDEKPGHNRVASLAYMLARPTHLVLAHPWVSEPSPASRTAYAFLELRRFGYLVDTTPESLPSGASIIEVPLDSARVFVALNLTPHPAIEALVRAGQWRRFSIARSNR